MRLDTAEQLMFNLGVDPQRKYIEFPYFEGEDASSRVTKRVSLEAVKALDKDKLLSMVIYLADQNVALSVRSWITSAYKTSVEEVVKVLNELGTAHPGLSLGEDNPTRLSDIVKAVVESAIRIQPNPAEALVGRIVLGPRSKLDFSVSAVSPRSKAYWLTIRDGVTKDALLHKSILDSVVPREEMIRTFLGLGFTQMDV